jgi:hypothetical protein
MKRKLLFVAGLATGYVAGSRAGRSAYTTLAEKLRAARESEQLQSVVGKVKEVAQERVPRLTAAVSTAADTTSSVAEAVATAPDPESGSGSESQSESQEAPSAPTADESTDSAPEAKAPSTKRGGRPKSAPAPATPDSAEEAAKVFEEQLPEAGGADQSATPTATS